MADSQCLYGREQAVADLIAQLGQRRWLMLLGAAFSGKTSLLQAGVIPQLRAQGWQVLDPLRLGRDPWRALHQVLDRHHPITEPDLIHQGLIPWVDQLPSQAPVLMVIDPFEELFTLGTTLADPAEVIECLTEVAQLPESPLRILISVRTELLDECLRYPCLRQEMQRGIFPLGPLTEAALTRLISDPLEAQGKTVDPQWVRAVVEQLDPQPYGLPWLQSYLTTLWGEQDLLTGELPCDRSRLPAAFTESLDQWAETTCQSLADQERSWLELICLRLVRTDLHRRDVCNPQPRRRLLTLVPQAEQEDLSALLDHLTQVGLLRVTSDPSGEPLFDLCHGALIEGWHRLWAWREEDRDLRSWLDRVEDAWWAWECRERAPERLLKELWLDQLQPYWPDLEPWVSEDIRKFYDRSQLIPPEAPAEPEVISAEQQVQAAIETLEIQPLQGLAQTIQLVGSYLASSSRPLSGPLQSCLYLAMERARESQCLLSHQESVLAVAYSPDQSLIASGGDDRMIRLWDRQGSLVVPPFPAHHGAIFTLAFSPDSQVLASAGVDRAIRFWTRQGQFLGQFQGHEGYVWQVAFSPKGDCLVSGGADGLIRLWDQQGRAVVPPWQAHEGRVRCVAFSPDGKWLVSGGEDQQLRFWDRQGQPLSTSIPSHEGRILTVAISPNGEWVVSGGEDRRLRIWDCHGSPVCEPILAHEGYVRAVAISPDGEVIISGGADQLLKLWTPLGEPLCPPWIGHEGEGSINTVAFSPSGDQVVSGSDDQTVRLWDFRGLFIGELRGHTARVRAVACSLDGQKIVSGSHDRTLKLWDRQGTAIGEPWQGHQRPVVSVAFHPKGHLVASGSHDRTVRLWDLQGRAATEPLEGHKGSVWGVTFSPDGTLLASGSHDRTIRLWDLQGHPVGQPFVGHEGSINAIAFSPDGQVLASGSADGTIRLWDLQGCPIGSPLQGHEGYIFTIAFSPDGQHILSGGDDQTLRLWDRQGHPIGSPWMGHEARVGAVAYSPDGQTVASCGDDHTIRLWDPQGQSIGVPLQAHHQGTISALTFSPDGQVLISGGDDGTVQLWRANWHAWLGISCERIRHHPLFQAPTDQVLQAACKTCYEHVWSLETANLAGSSS